MKTNQMKRVCYAMIGTGFVLSLMVLLFCKDNWLYFYCCAPYLALSFFITGLPEKLLPRVTLLAVWMTGYHVLALIFLATDVIDLYHVEWNFLVQYFVPFLIGMLVLRPHGDDAAH